MADNNVRDMGPTELKAFAAQGETQRSMVEQELKRRWKTFTSIPETPFKSILDD